MLRITISALIAAAALVASGCGGGDGGGGSGASPEAFAADVCGAISDWQKELQTSASTMQSKLSGSSSPADVKSQLVAFMDGAVAATDKMVAKVEEAGPPDIEDGEKLQADLEAGLGKAQDAFKQASDKAKSLPSDDPAAFQREAQALSATLQEQGTAIQTTFSGLDTKYDSKELNEAFQKEPACSTL